MVEMNELQQKMMNDEGMKVTSPLLPLLTALQALDIKGEVITTPYSFVATTHAIWGNGCQPVFVDIDPTKIEAAITPRTKAIMPVHVYGNPCDTEAMHHKLTEADVEKVIDCIK
jgi:dTDP-4-amino-4,6-dideoxygalactose transaminase